MNRSPAKKAVTEARLAVVDALSRQGQSESDIAKHLLTSPESVDNLLENGISQTELPFPEKVRMMLPVVKHALNTLKQRYFVPIGPEARTAALAEYVGREDEIYRTAWKDHTDAFDYRDKLAALKLAQTAAQNKARAMGVSLTPDPNQALPAGMAGGLTINNIGELAIIGQQVTPRLGNERSNGYPQLDSAAS